MTTYREPEKENTFDEWDEPRLHMEELMKTHLVTFDLPLRILLPLERHGIRRLSELVKESPKTLKRVKNLGKGAITRLEKFLHYHDLSFNKKRGSQ